MKGNGTDGPFCQAYSIDQLSGTVATSSRVQQTSASYQVVSLTGTPGISVNPGGYLFVACDSLKGVDFRVGSVNWNSP
jgi:hypothetical protein